MKFFPVLFLVAAFSFSLQASPESMVPQMTLDEKIGQLFIAGVYSNRSDAISEGQYEDPIPYIEKMIEKYHIGGLLFKMRWEPKLLHHYTKHFQGRTKVPLFTALDAEWGLNMRMASVLRFPKNQALGAINREELIYRMGSEIGRQCRLIGVNWNLSPVVDINSNPLNPVINDRSFGSDKADVARKAVLMIKGLQELGVMAAAKHFPGHGDTETDSHQGLPVLPFSLERLQEEELVPFSEAVNAGVKSVMTAHLLIPVIDEKLPASLSFAATTGLLKGKLGFQGLVVTDDLLMGAISKKFSPGDAALLAFKAGNDLIISSKDVEESFAAIKNALETGLITIAELDQKVMKILKAKEWLSGFPDSPENFEESALFTEEAYQLKRDLYRAAVHIHRDSKGLVPLEGRGSLLTLLQIGGEEGFTAFQKGMEAQFPVSYHYLPAKCTEMESTACFLSLEGSKRILVFLMGMNRSAADGYGMAKSSFECINKLAAATDVIVVIFGNPAIATQIDSSVSLIFAYEEDSDAETAAVEVLSIPKQLPKLGSFCLPKSEFRSCLGTKKKEGPSEGRPHPREG